MPIVKDAYRRYLLLDKYFSGKYFLNRESLLRRINEELEEEVSDSTIDKDIRVLKNEFRAPISAKGGYHYTDSKFSLPKMKLTPEEIRALDFAAGILSEAGIVPLAQEAKAVITALLRKSGEEHPEHKVISTDLSLSVKGVEWLPQLFEAINSRKALLVMYNSPRKKEVTKHYLSPYLLKEYQGLWYVIGYSKEKKFTLVLALDRIKEIKTANVDYQDDPNFNPAAYFKHSIGITHRYGYQPEKVVFWIEKEAYYYMEIQPLHVSQKVLREEKDGFVVQIEVILSEELLIKLMGLGGRVKVMAPANLVAQVKEHLARMSSYY